MTYLLIFTINGKFRWSTFSKNGGILTCEHVWRVAVSIFTPRNNNTEKKQLFHGSLSTDSLVCYGLVCYFLVCYLCSVRQQCNINKVFKQSFINILSAIINDRFNAVLRYLYVRKCEISSLQKLSCTWHGQNYVLFWQLPSWFFKIVIKLIGLLKFYHNGIFMGMFNNKKQCSLCSFMLKFNGLL